MTTILLAIGDPELRAACDSELSAAKLACLTLARPLAALTLASKVGWDAAVVDSTPFGVETLAALRALSMPARVIGLGLSAPGVSQVISLPLQAAELKLALGVLNGNGALAPQDTAALSLDPQRRLARANGDEVTLTRTEFRLLDLLRQHQPRDVSLDQVLEEIWGSREGYGTAELVRTHIRNLRQKLRQIGLSEAVTSRRGHGYALAEQ